MPQYTTTEFAKLVRKKYPKLDGYDDSTVASYMIQRHPIYQHWITDTVEPPSPEEQFPQEEFDPSFIPSPSDAIMHLKNTASTGAKLLSQVPSTIVGLAAGAAERGDWSKYISPEATESYEKYKEIHKVGTNPLTGEKLPWYKKQDKKLF